jgi:hypothetical protein
MSGKGKGHHVEALLGLIDLEGVFAHAGQRWLKADQPTIAAKLGCSPRTLRNVTKHPAFQTHRTRLGGKNFTLIRRADAESANGQIGKSKSANRQSPKAKSATKPATKSAAKPASKSAIHATFEQLAMRDELRLIWVRHRFMPDNARVTKAEYGLLLQLAKLGITPDEFLYVLNNWMEFLSCVNAICTHDGCTSALKAYRPEPWLGTIAEFPKAAKEVYITKKQWEDGYNLQEKLELDKIADEL